MRDEIFNIDLNFNNQYWSFTVKADHPAGPECMGCDYDIFQGRTHLYTLSQCKNEDEIECWEVKKKPREGYDPELVQQIGRRIDEHYN